MCESHPAQHIRRFSELNIVVRDDLHVVAPRVEEVEKRSRQGLDARVDQCFASRLLVIDHKAKMTSIVGGLGTALLKCEELVPQINERHGVVFAAKIKFKQATVKGQSCVDVTDLDSNVIETDS